MNFSVILVKKKISIWKGERAWDQGEESDSLKFQLLRRTIPVRCPQINV